MFAKIFTQIFDSSIAENYQVRHVFEDLLKLCDRNGVIDMTAEAIARRTNVPIEIVKSGIEQLAKPDASSRSREFEGRRIVLLDEHRDWGWQIVNYEFYRNLNDEESRRAYFRDAKQRARARQTGATPPEELKGLEPVKRFQKPELEEMNLYAQQIQLPMGEVVRFQNYYESNGWKVGRNPMKDWQAAMRNWKVNCNKYESRTTNPAQRIDRSIGTANEGTASQYRGLKCSNMAKVAGA